MRGMKKWLPFKSLSGQYEVLDQMRAERNKKEKPELSIDEIDDLNRALVSLQKGDVTKVTYFHEGEILNKTVVFVKCDGYAKTVFFKGFSLPFTSLLKLEN